MLNGLNARKKDALREEVRRIYASVMKDPVKKENPELFTFRHAMSFASCICPAAPVAEVYGIISTEYLNLRKEALHCGYE